MPSDANASLTERRQLYVCVYRRRVPTPSEWRKSVKLARSDKRLARFLDEYWRCDSFYNWGDDPSFFSAREVLGDAPSCIVGRLSS